MKRTMLFLLLVAAPLFAEQPAIAIIDLEAKLCAKELADAVSDILRTEVIGSGRFRVIERAQLAKVMEEHAFQLSGMVDASTVAEFGKLVGADYVALGSVSVLGGTYTVTLRFIDVETAEAVLGKTESTNSQSGLPDVCRRLAAALTGLPYSGSGDDYSYSSGSSGAGRIVIPHVSAFYDPQLDDWIVYALADSGGLYMLHGDHFDRVTQMPGTGPYDVAAFYDPEDDDWIVYAVNGPGMLYRLKAKEFVGVDQIPGGGPFDVTAFYEPDLDDWIVYAFNGAGKLYRLAGNVFQPIASLP